MDAVSRGKLHIVNSIASAVYNNGTEQRLSDSLRNRKNYLIILNTLLRKAAEYGDVHPLHINKMSSSFAQKIEDIRTVEHSFNLQTEMIRSYCLLVKQHSLKDYSYLIGKTITIISYDLTADLALNNLANKQRPGLSPHAAALPTCAPRQLEHLLLLRVFSTIPRAGPTGHRTRCHPPARSNWPSMH